ncbi:1,4-dihydroxy-6-naphtoate synthase [uncultured Desulfatiglans sp.]|uniref:1,4-dihydroxy-6-naphtoate synthase n=1 Tax=Uncultured Desulfatiglans sp. TaxID=1748965 RepID=A0A652ZZV6_UNCDX|nr:1,4-dihydroxy-6-naphtoate synthase [uncultured Desulfatiglans sp.]
MTLLEIGYSPCPNDTFIMAALAEGRIDTPLRFQPVLADVETLNVWAEKGRLPVTKLSFFALGHVLEGYGLLSTGAALGKGCGPLLIARPGTPPNRLETACVASPGKRTTAGLLLSLYLGREPAFRQMVYSEIMPSVERGECEFGLIIHESRFTYPAHGLEAVLDLGAWWEETTGCPIPLGGIAARRDLGPEAARLVNQAIRASLLAARAGGDAISDYTRRHAQEMDPEVMRRHIDLYVNDYSLDLGTAGLAAVETLFERARTAGLLPACGRPIMACPL